MYAVNNRFMNVSSSLQPSREWTIKGAWDGAHPEVQHCWLMRSDGTGHAYTGKVTPVKDVWRITEHEFADMIAGHFDWFEPVVFGSAFINDKPLKGNGFVLKGLHEDLESLTKRTELDLKELTTRREHEATLVKQIKNRDCEIEDIKAAIKKLES